MSSCPLIRGTGIKAKGKDECKVCPFRDDCVQDIFDDAMAKIMEILGHYIGSKSAKRDDN